MKTLSLFGSTKSSYLLCVSFLSTGMTAFLTFPRSLQLYNLGLSVVLYGTLLALSNAFLFVLNIAAGRVCDKYGCEDLLLKLCLCICIVCHACFVFVNNLVLLSALLVVENTASRLFTVFVSPVISRVNPDHYGKGLGLYKIAGSLAWMICASASGYIFSLLGFRFLMIVITCMAVAKLYFLLKLLDSYNRGKPVHKAKIAASYKSVLRPVVVNSLVLYTVLQMQSNGGFSYLQIYFSTELGLDEVVSGYILACSGIAEIFISLLIGKYCDQGELEARIAVVLGAVISALRWIIISFTGIPLIVLVLTQFMHGVMICTINISFIDYLKSLVNPAVFSTAIGIAGSLSCLGTMVASGLFGFMSSRIGLGQSYRMLGIISLLFAAVFIILHPVCMRYERKENLSIV